MSTFELNLFNLDLIISVQILLIEITFCCLSNILSLTKLLLTKKGFVSNFVLAPSLRKSADLVQDPAFKKYSYIMEAASHQI